MSRRIGGGSGGKGKAAAVATGEAHRCGSSCGGAQRWRHGRLRPPPQRDFCRPAGFAVRHGPLRAHVRGGWRRHAAARQQRRERQTRGRAARAGMSPCTSATASVTSPRVRARRRRCACPPSAPGI